MGGNQNPTSFFHCVGFFSTWHQQISVLLKRVSLAEMEFFFFFFFAWSLTSACSCAQLNLTLYHQTGPTYYIFIIYIYLYYIIIFLYVILWKGSHLTAHCVQLASPCSAAPDSWGSLGRGDETPLGRNEGRMWSFQPGECLHVSCTAGLYWGWSSGPEESAAHWVSVHCPAGGGRQPSTTLQQQVKQGQSSATFTAVDSK